MSEDKILSLLKSSDLYQQKPATNLIAGLENELDKLKRVNVELNEQ